MHRAIPVSNKILSKKWDDNNHRIHAEKIKNMQSRVKSTKPTKFDHLKHKAKKEQMLEERYTEIERENRILLEKMSSIMNKKKNKDRELEIKSLNKNARKEEMRRITLENQALLKRLQEKSPCYNSHHWEEERRKTEKHLENMCEFPYSLGRGSSTPISFKRPRKLSPLAKLKVFKQSVDISGTTYQVEILKNKKNLNITLNQSSQNEKFSLTLPLNEAYELIGNSSDYQNLLELLEVDNGEIVLVNKNPETVQGKNTSEARKKPQKTENFQKNKKGPKNLSNFKENIQDDEKYLKSLKESEDYSGSDISRPQTIEPHKQNFSLEQKIENVDRFFGFEKREEKNLEGTRENCRESDFKQEFHDKSKNSDSEQAGRISEERKSQEKQGLMHEESDFSRNDRREMPVNINEDRKGLEKEEFDEEFYEDNYSSVKNDEDLESFEDPQEVKNENYEKKSLANHDLDSNEDLDEEKGSAEVDEDIGGE